MDNFIKLHFNFLQSTCALSSSTLVTSYINWNSVFLIHPPSYPPPPFNIGDSPTILSILIWNLHILTFR